MSMMEIESLKIVIYDFAEESKLHGKKRSRWECLQFAARAIEGNVIPKEIMAYIAELNRETTLIKS